MRRFDRGLGRTFWALLALTAGGAALRFSTLRTQSYWYDEAITVGLVRRSFTGMLGALPHSESTPPFYYVLAWGWARLLGTGEAGLRSLSALLGTATIPATYFAARSFVLRRSSLVAATLVAVSPLLVWYSQEARAYALLVFLGALTLALLCPAAETSGERWLGGWAFTSALALATHYFAVFLIAPEAAWLLYRMGNARPARRAVAIVAIVGCLLAPLAAYQARYSEHTAWISNSASPAGRLAYLLHQLVIGAYPATHIRLLLAAVPVVLLVGALTWTGRDDRAGALRALAFAAFAIGAPLLAAVAGDRFFAGRGDYFIYRNLIVATIPLTIAAAAVIGAARGAGLVVLGIACVLLVAVSVAIARRPSLQRPDVRAVAAMLGAPRRARVVVVDIRTATVLKLYRPLEALPKLGAPVAEVDLVPEPDQSRARSLPRGFRLFATDRIDTFTISRFRLGPPLLERPPTLSRLLPSSRQVSVLRDSR